MRHFFSYRDTFSGCHGGVIIPCFLVTVGPDLIWGDISIFRDMHASFQPVLHVDSFVTLALFKSVRL